MPPPPPRVEDTPLIAVTSKGAELERESEYLKQNANSEIDVKRKVGVRLDELEEEVSESRASIFGSGVIKYCLCSWVMSV